MGLDEFGTPTLPIVPFIADHPFLYLIRADTTGAILFMDEWRIQQKTEQFSKVGWAERQRNPSLRDAGKCVDGFRLRLNPSYAG